MSAYQSQKESKTKRLTKRERFMEMQRQQEGKKRKLSWKSAVSGGLLLLGILLIAWEIILYKDTLIHLSIPMLVWLVPSVLALPLTSKLTEGYPDLFKLIYNVGAVGGICLFSFMALNFYGATGKVEQVHVAISKTGTEGGSWRHCTHPYVTVEVKGLEKQLLFPCGSDVESHNYVDLTIEEGLFGFYLVKEKSLAKH